MDTNAFLIYDNSDGDKYNYGRDLINSGSVDDAINITQKYSVNLVDTVVYSNESDSYLLGCKNKTVYKSINGIDWTPLSNISTAFHLSTLYVFNNSPTVFVVSSSYTKSPPDVGRLYKSTDGGKTWTNVLNSTGDNFFAMAESPRDGYLYISEYDINVSRDAWHLLMSQDNGDHWSVIFDAEEMCGNYGDDRVRHLHGTFVDSTNTVWVGTGDNESFRRTYMSKNHGSSWSEISGGFQGHDGYLVATEIDGWVYWGSDKVGVGILRTPAGNGTYWENWDLGPKQNVSKYGLYMQYWDLFTYDGIMYSLQAGPAGNTPSVMVSVVGQPHWVALHRAPWNNAYSQSTHGIYQYDGEKFFFVHNSYGHTFKVNATTWRAVYHAIWGYPEGKTSAIVELKENETTYLSFQQSPLFNAEARFVGWDNFNYIASGKWNFGPTFEDRSKIWNKGSASYCNLSQEYAHTGQYSLQLNMTPNTTHKWYSNFTYSNFLQPGCNYTASYWIKSDRNGVDTAFWSGLVTQIYYGNGSYDKVQHNLFYIDQNWTRHNYSFYCPEGGSIQKIQVMFYLQFNGTRNVIAYLDDVQIEKGNKATTFKNGTTKQTKNPIVNINGVNYSYPGTLSEGSTSTWFKLGNLTIANITAFNQSFKLEFRSNFSDAPKMSCHKALISNDPEGNLVPISVKNGSMVNITGYLPAGQLIQRVGSICYRIDDTRANISGINVTSTGEVRLYLNETDTWNLSALVEDTDDGSAPVASWWAQLSGTSVSYSFGLKPNCLYRLLVDDVWFADNTSDGGGQCMFNYSGSSSGHVFELNVMPIPMSITSPTSDSTYSTNKSAIDLGGTADDDGGVTSVTWSNAATGASGTATGTTSWTIDDILLQMGSNLITVTANNAAGNHGWDTINVTRTTSSWNTIYITSDEQFASKASDNGWPGDGTQSNPYVIYDYDINASSANGIDIRSTTVYFNILGCDITSTTHSYRGIYFSNVKNGSIEDTDISDCSYGIQTGSSSNIDIAGGVIMSCSTHATYIVGNDIGITGLNASSNTGNGIYVLSSNGVTIEDCIAKSNSNNGIHLISCTETEISGGNYSSNSWRGIYVAGGNDTLISGTYTSSNGYDGIYLTSISSVSAKNVTVTGAISTANSKYGIYMVSCRYVTITDCNASLNNDTGYAGICVAWLSNASITLINNDLWKNNYGIYLKDSTGVSVYNNDLLKNYHQAYDNRGKWNAWCDNSTSSGNHWSDWTSPDIDPEDGIVDDPYSIPGSSPYAKDWYPKVSECT